MGIICSSLQSQVKVIIQKVINTCICHSVFFCYQVVHSLFKVVGLGFKPTSKVHGSVMIYLPSPLDPGANLRCFKFKFFCKCREMAQENPHKNTISSICMKKKKYAVKMYNDFFFCGRRAKKKYPVQTFIIYIISHSSSEKYSHYRVFQGFRLNLGKSSR